MHNDNIKPWGISSLPWCGYANDLILFTLDINSLQKATNILDEVFSSYGLCINDAKTVTMILNHGYLQEEYPTSIINLRNIPLHNSSEFKYLGSYLSHSEPSTGDIEINHRIQMAYNKFVLMSNLLQNRHIFLKTRVKFLNSFVRSRLTYSCQNWNLTLRQYEKLDVTYRNLLRRMVRGGFKRRGNDDSDFRYKLSNDKIHNICGTSNVRILSKINKKASHVVRMPSERSTKQLIFNDKYHRVGRAIPSLLKVFKNDESNMDVFINNSMKY